jgi:hypothetical protein
LASAGAEALFHHAVAVFRSFALSRLIYRNDGTHNYWTQNYAMAQLPWPVPGLRPCSTTLLQFFVLSRFRD